MAVAWPFTAEHVTSLAARGAELERIGEQTQNPNALVRAARLYQLAVRITDDIDQREPTFFTYADLARVRDELRTLATDTALARMPSDDHLPSRGTIDATGEVTRMFREIAARVEQRLAADDTHPRPQPDVEPRA
jgi:hypothetical protein